MSLHFVLYPLAGMQQHRQVHNFPLFHIPKERKKSVLFYTAEIVPSTLQLQAVPVQTSQRGTVKPNVF